MDIQGVLHARGFARTLDLSRAENDGKYFEGTGALVLDRINGVAYVNLSERADRQIAEHWAQKLGYRASNLLMASHISMQVRRLCRLWTLLVTIKWECSTTSSYHVLLRHLNTFLIIPVLHQQFVTCSKRTRFSDPWQQCRSSESRLHCCPERCSTGCGSSSKA